MLYVYAQAFMIYLYCSLYGSSMAIMMRRCVTARRADGMNASRLTWPQKFTGQIMWLFMIGVSLPYLHSQLKRERLP